MKSKLRKHFAAAVLGLASVSLSLNATAAPETDTTPQKTGEPPTLAFQKPDDLNSYISKASDINLRSRVIYKRFIRNILDGIAKNHAVRPEIQQVESLALEGIRELTTKQADYTLEELVEAALDYVTAKLDPHSAYLNKDEWRKFKQYVKGSFAGIGIRYTPDQKETGFIRVTDVIAGSPAEKAGLQAGDTITHVDGAPLNGKSIKEAAELLSGDEGKDVNLQVQKKGTNVAVPVSLIRATIETEVASGKQIGNVAYIRLERFMGNAAAQFEKALAQLQSDIGDSLKGIVIDLRLNGGGLVPESVRIADAFLESGNVVSFGDAHGNLLPDPENLLSAKPGVLAKDVPVIVLVDGGSASASEILAGALQDHGRAIVMGTQTFGKGTAQTIMDLGQRFNYPDRTPREDAIKITTELHYTPSGDTIQNKGVTPNIRTEFQGTASDGRVGMSEAKIDGAIPDPGKIMDNTETESICTSSSKAPNISTLDENLILEINDGTKQPDYQLLCAIEFLEETSEFTAIKPVHSSPNP